MRITVTGLLGVSVTPAGPVHTVFKVIGTSTDGLNSTVTVQVRVTVDPMVIIPVGLLVMLTVGVGTKQRVMLKFSS